MTSSTILMIINNKIDGLCSYITNHNLKSLVLGISGGIDSTVTAYIASKAAAQAGIQLIGRSLPSSTNSFDEYDTSTLVGEAFCPDFKEVSIENIYQAVSEFCDEITSHEPIAEGNLKARIRMMYLYNCAWYNNGIVLDTDNRTEHELGFWTINGDQFDLGVLRDLYKTEIIEIAYWLLVNGNLNDKQKEALSSSLNLDPTDGNGTDPDLVQYGEPTFQSVDTCIQFIKNSGYIPEDLEISHPILVQRYRKSWFKKAGLPLFIDKDGRLRNHKEQIIV